MTADRDDLAALLHRHSDITGMPDGLHCICGELLDAQRVEDDGWDTAHRAHVAQMVLESDWLRGVKADAHAQGLRDWADELDKPPYDLWDRAAIPRLRDRADRVDAEDNTTDRT